MLPLSSETLDEALSCPTYMEENSVESLDFGQTFQELPSEQKILRKSREM